MNWKKFTDECRTVGKWLDENYGHTQKQIVMLMKILAAILLEEKQPEKLVGWAVSSQPLRKITQLSSGQIHSIAPLPDTISELISRWVCLLPRDSGILGTVYEELASGCRFRGLYYTPAAAVAFILKHTLEQEDIVARPRIRILDPACGCGSFLLQAYRILFTKFKRSRQMLQEKYPEEDWSDSGIHRHILQYNLWGADIDEVAADITAAGLALQCPDSNAAAMPPHIIAYDSLKRPAKADTPEFLRKFWLSSYDYVIGNPPYLSFGLRGARRLDSQYGDYLRQAYPESAQYKLSYYVLFLQRGIEMLAEKGKLGFIIPDSFLLGRYYSKIRHYILEHTTIDLIAHISSAVFKRAAVGYLTICVFTKCSEARELSKQNQLAIYQINRQSGFEKVKPVCQYHQSYFSQLPYDRFRIFFNLKTKQLIDRFDKLGLPLKNFADGHTGIRSLSQQKEIIATAPQEDASWQRGLVSGREVNRFSVDYQHHWLHVAPELLYKGGWKKEIIQQRKILIRQTGYMLIAGIDNKGLYHLNNIHSFVLNQQTVTLDYLLLLLNSKLLSFYYHAVTMEYGRAMAQTDIEALELLPVIVNRDINRQAPELVQIMENLTIKSRSKDSSSQQKAAAFDDYLNQIVYRIYGLTDQDIEYVEECEGN